MSKLVQELLNEIEKRGLDIAKFSRETGIRADRIYQWVRGRGNPKAEDMVLIQKWMDEIPENVLREKSESYQQKRLSLKNHSERPKIPIYESALHTLSNMELYKDDQSQQIPDFWITIPQLRDCDFGCRATGSSMYPLIQSNALVIGRQIMDMSVIVFGEIYIVHTRNNLQTIKYIQESSKGPEWLKLVPYNEKATSTEIKRKDILRLYEVKGYFNML